MSDVMLPDQTAIRARFPALAGDTIFLENAGGSQVPDFVADRIHRYMTQTYVQLGAGYELSRIVISNTHSPEIHSPKPISFHYSSTFQPYTPSSPPS